MGTNFKFLKKKSYKMTAVKYECSAYKNMKLPLRPTQ